MKTSIDIIKKHLRKNYGYIFLLSIIIILIITNVKAKKDLNDLNKKITGTYIMGEEISRDAEYFVLTDKEYYRYKQFENIEEGEYEKIDNNLYVLKNDYEEYFVHNSNEIYYFNIKQNKVQIYSKKSDNSILINIP
ncbi:hypothetical protein [Sedimentibacter sp.]|uniref:hypothetical protein n=1 Tax=Sedimentibacter sp. TaxID=1960295 RepID=UPI00289BF519|nr:hypothetical protein [Sedimentibacter sp.]